MSVADSAVGAILEIPPGALDKIEKAEKAIKALGDTSARTAKSVSADWGTTAITGLDTFIRKVKEAESKLGKITMPKLDATGFASGISDIASAMATIDRSTITGAKRLEKVVSAVASIDSARSFADMLKEIARGITAIGSTSSEVVSKVSTLATSMASLARDIRTVEAARRMDAESTAKASEYNRLYKEQAELVRRRNELLEKGASTTDREKAELQAVRNRITDIIQEIDKLNRKKQTSASQLANIVGSTRVGQADARSSVSGAIHYAKQAKSLQELQDAYRNLKKVMSTVDPKSSDWQQLNKTYQETKKRIDGIRKSMGELQAQSRQTSNAVSQMRNQLAAVFSVTAIAGYLKKMVQVRAQFELQNVALRAILQNKDEADKIFMQVQQMALQSPFTIMQLTTYTKQLAAYRIEASKLVGTTKMLADVSAGLGVDMQRLILAYGQVKAANYLRATEVRQFTEAGLNIAGELANYFSELQGKMISVGDVMDMITKRMVRFEDVEEVFRRVTSAGGLFYDMQRKQSESLYGQMQRISDAYSIMMNEIGQSNQSTISDALSLVRELIANWRKLLPYLAAFGAFFAGKAIVATLAPIVKSFATIRVLLVDIINKQITWNALASKNVWGAVVSVLVSVVTYFALANDESSQLADNLSRIRSEASSDLKESIADFHQLAKTATDATKSYTERKEALDSLNKGYKDILPSYMLEAEWLERNIQNYDSAIAKIKEYFQAKEMQKQIETILGSEDFTDAVKEMQELGEDMLRQGLFDATVTKRYTDKWMQEIAQEIASGKIENSAEAVSKRLSEIFGKEIFISESQWRNISKHFQNLNKEINHIQLGTIGATNQAELWGKELEQLSTGQLAARIEDTKRQMEVVERAMAVAKATGQGGIANPQIYGIESDKNFVRLEELEQMYNELSLGVNEYEKAMATAWGRETSAKIEEQIDILDKEITKVADLTIQRNNLERTSTGTEAEKKRLAELNEELELAKKRTIAVAYSMGVTLTDAELANIDNMFDLQRLLDDVAKRAYPELAKKSVEEVGKGETAIKSLVDKVDWLKRAINSLSSGLGLGTVFEDVLTETDTKAEETKKDIEAQAKLELDRNEAYIKQAAERIGVDAKLISSNKNLIKSRDKSDKDYAKVLREQAKAWKDEKARVDTMSDAQRKFYFEKNNLTQESIDLNAKLADGLEDIANAYDPIAAKKKGGGSGGRDPWIELFKERSKAVEDFYKQYESLKAKFSESESQRRAMSSFESYFKSVGLNMADVISKGWDTQGLISNIEQLKKELKKHFGAIYDEAESIMKKGITLDVVENPNAEQKLAHGLAKIIHDLEKSVADNKVKLDIEIQDAAKDRMQKEMEDLMATYDLTKTFTKMGLSADLTNMFGKDPIKNLDELKQKVHEVYAEYDLGTEGAKVMEDMLKKIADMQNKALEARAKNYYDIMLNSVSKAAQIQLKAQRDLNEAMASEDLDAWTKKQRAMQINAKMQADLQENAFKEFQSSDIYVSIFSDIEHASKATLEYVIGKLKEMKDGFKDLPADQVRAIVSQLERAQQALASRNSFWGMGKDLKDALTYMRQRNSLQAEAVELDRQLADSRERLANTEMLINQLSNKTNSIKDKDSVEYKQAATALEQQRRIWEKINKEIKEYLEKLGINTGKINAGNAALGRAQNVLDGLANIASSASSSLGEIASAFEMMGWSSAEMADNLGVVTSALGGLSTMLSGAGQMLFGTNPFEKISGAISAIGGLATMVGNLFSMGDKKKERQIKKLQGRVEDLDRAYQKLSDSINDAFTMDDYKMGSEMMEQNINAQIKSYEKMIRLENDKKKRDGDKIKEWKNTVADLREQLDEIEKAKIEAFGGFGSESNVAQAAEDFASVWFDAFKETGDGLEALEEKWDEYIDNLILKQMVMSVVGKRIRALTDMVDKAVSGDSEGGEELTRNELDKINAERERIMSNLNNELKEWLAQMGYFGKGNTVLSDLQKGIQNITEPQAAAIEAYLNSMRFAVFRHTEQLDALILAVSAQYGGLESPMLTEVKGIRALLATIDSRLSAVTEVKPGRGTVLKIG